MKLQILGQGCPNCKKLEKRVRKAVENSEENIELGKVYDIEEASLMGLTSPPGLAVNGTVKIQGRIPSVDEIEDLISGK